MGALAACPASEGLAPEGPAGPAVPRVELGSAAGSGTGDGTASATATTAVASTGAPTDPAVPEPSWERSLERARARAARQHRLLLVWVRAEWAVASLAMGRALWDDARVRRALSPVVLAELDVTVASPATEQAAAAIGSRAVPELVLLAADGRELGRLGASATADELLRLLAEADLLRR